jgi:hypothetical protein
MKLSYSRVNFTNILRKFCAQFLHLNFRFELFLAQEYWRKCAHKMLVKWTHPRWQQKKRIQQQLLLTFLASNQLLHSFIITIHSTRWYAGLFVFRPISFLSMLTKLSRVFLPSWHSVILTNLLPYFLKPMLFILFYLINYDSARRFPTRILNAQDI